MEKNSLHRLGDYIREVDVRNENLEVKLSQGISNEKHFQQPKQVAENPYKDKIVRKGQFAFNRATTRNGNKISIAYREDEDCTVSASYCVFYVTNEKILLSKYLMMWFRRPEFDRYAIYHSHGSAHEYFTFENMCEVVLPIPPIDQQQKIVSEYETITRRIRLNEQIIAKLEETAGALYRKMFVDGIDKEHLPEGWRMGTLGEICEVNPKTSLSKGEYCDFIEMENIPTKGFFINKSSIRKYSGGSKFKNGDILFARITPCLENGKVGIVQNLKDKEIAAGSTEFIVLRGNGTKLTSLLSVLARDKSFREYAKSQMKGTDGRQRVDAQALLKYNMYLPTSQKLIEYEKVLSTIVNLSLIYSQENNKLQELQSLLLTRLGQ